ncbi:PHP-associated domain-containing protein [Halomarina halobia]|uniref:PHP-associated domain-containing protein n=1 Tax=Halomarina halobia TaxID=3033386 RepID=A0ABD6ACZ2_9EURY|nr:PHP-associated domain-containing protein [Halomarina sp. PSR21]
MHVKILDARVVERAKARGLDAVVYAPHFTRLPSIEAKARAFSDDDLLVIPAREIFTGSWRDRKHVLAVGLSKPIPDFVTLDGAMREIDRQGAAALAPHPEFLNVSLSRADIERYDVRAVEVYNPKHWEVHNERAREIARLTGLPGFGSSYAHLRGSVGEAWTTFEEPIEGAADLAARLRSGASMRVFRRDGVEHNVRRALEFAHLGYENTWGKVDRVLLSATEPTHPGHVAYEGRFDDVRVY